MFQQVSWQLVLLITVLLWLAVLTFLQIKIFNHWKKFTAGGRGQRLDKLLEDILATIDSEHKQLKTISEEQIKQQMTQNQSFTKHSLVRFNPFEDTGGDQSFVVALLNQANSGFVISSLHTRGGTRVYAKEVAQAKPTKHQFSKEEKEAVEKAARQA